MITSEDLPILQKLLSYPTSGEQKAFLDGLQYNLKNQDANPGNQAHITMVPVQPPDLKDFAKDFTSAYSSPSKPKKYRFKFRGLQSAVLRLLWTGPANRRDLEPHLPGVDPSALTSCLRRLIQKGLATDLGHPTHAYGLTTQGRFLAKWYVEHPQAKTIPSTQEAFPKESK